MKRIVQLSFLCFLSATAMAQTLTIKYVTEFSTAGAGVPLAIAAGSKMDGIYYTLFATSNPNTTGCYYVADPLGDNAPEKHILVDDGLDTEVPLNRGFTGVAVDDKGNVYLALDNGANDTATVRKHGPKPNFPLLTEFGGGIIHGGKRYNAVEVISEGILAVTTFSTVEFWNADTAEILYEVGGGETYQRDLAYNPLNGDIYLAKNREVAGLPISSANLLSGGKADNLEGYTTIQPNFIPQGGAGGQYGVNNQLIEYDVFNDLIIIPDYSETQRTVALYHPADTTKPIAKITGSESPNKPLQAPADAATVTLNTGNTLLYITDFGAKRILVYQIIPQSNLPDWERY